MTQPITKSQLDSLERAADKVFGKLGIDIEFTRHFLDRVNDERNRQQITIRELGMLFAKEYKRWGRAISKMPINSQAVMKDLSTELNVPFVLNKDGDEKDLVAKTIMRKKDFKTPNQELPVENVNEDELYYVQSDGSWLKGGDGRSKGRKRSELPKGAKIREEKHGAKRGTQVKGKDATPKMTKPSRKGQQPHPMRGKLVGEALSESQQFTLQKGAWEVEQLRERIASPKELILKKALEYMDKLATHDDHRQDLGGYAFDIVRAFDLTGIATAKELAGMYQEWKGDALA